MLDENSMSRFWNYNLLLNSLTSSDHFTPGVHYSNLMAGKKFFFDIFKGQSWYVLTHSKGVFTKERSKINKICGFEGQIKSFCGPHLARGPYVVHACIISYFLRLEKSCKTLIFIEPFSNPGKVTCQMPFLVF